MLTVAPYVGAWIETFSSFLREEEGMVAPYVGAWIETCINEDGNETTVVAPYVGARIETRMHETTLLRKWRSTLRGCED